MSTKKIKQCEHTNTIKSKDAAGEIFVLPPKVLEKLGINLHNIQAVPECFADVKTQIGKDVKVNNDFSGSLNKDVIESQINTETSILETADLMKKSVFLSPTFTPATANVLSGETEIINTGLDQEYNSIIGLEAVVTHDKPYIRKEHGIINNDFKKCDECFTNDVQNIKCQTENDDISTLNHNNNYGSIIINNDHQVAYSLNCNNVEHTKGVQSMPHTSKKNVSSKKVNIISNEIIDSSQFKEYKNLNSSTMALIPLSDDTISRNEYQEQKDGMPYSDTCYVNTIQINKQYNDKKFTEIVENSLQNKIIIDSPVCKKQKHNRVDYSVGVSHTNKKKGDNSKTTEEVSNSNLICGHNMTEFKNVEKLANKVNVTDNNFDVSLNFIIKENVLKENENVLVESVTKIKQFIDTDDSRAIIKSNRKEKSALQTLPDSLSNNNSINDLNPSLTNIDQNITAEDLNVNTYHENNDQICHFNNDKIMVISDESREVTIFKDNADEITAYEPFKLTESTELIIGTETINSKSTELENNMGNESKNISLIDLQTKISNTVISSDTTVTSDNLDEQNSNKITNNCNKLYKIGFGELDENKSCERKTVHNFHDKITTQNDAQKLKIQNSNVPEDKVKEIAVYLSKYAEKTKIFPKSKQSGVQSKLSIQGVEKPGGLEIDIITKKFYKTYQRHAKVKQTSHPFTNVMKFEIREAPEINLTFSNVNNVCETQKFCECSDFGRLNLYDCDVGSYEHIHFNEISNTNCDAFIIFTIYNNDNEPKMSPSMTEDYTVDHDDHTLKTAKLICWNMIENQINDSELRLDKLSPLFVDDRQMSDLLNDSEIETSKVLYTENEAVLQTNGYGDSKITIEETSSISRSNQLENKNSESDLTICTMETYDERVSEKPVEYLINDTANNIVIQHYSGIRNVTHDRLYSSIRKNDYINDNSLIEEKDASKQKVSNGNNKKKILSKNYRKPDKSTNNEPQNQKNIIDSTTRNNRNACDRHKKITTEATASRRKQNRFLLELSESDVERKSKCTAISSEQQDVTKCTEKTRIIRKSKSSVESNTNVESDEIKLNENINKSKTNCDNIVLDNEPSSTDAIIRRKRGKKANKINLTNNVISNYEKTFTEKSGFDNKESSEVPEQVKKNRKRKRSSIQSTEHSGDNSSEGKNVKEYRRSSVNLNLVKCGVCCLEVDVSQWIEHIAKSHNYLAWKDKEEPLDVNDEILVRQHLFDISKQIGGLICSNCGLKRKYVKSYLDHVKICNGKKISQNLNESESNISSEITLNISCVKCGVCQKEMETQQWFDHIFKEHEYMAWAEGQKPIDLDDNDNVSKHLNNIVKKIGTLICRKCGLKRKYVKSYLHHTSVCQGEIFSDAVCDTSNISVDTESEQKSEIDITCQDILECAVCHEKVLPKDWKSHAMQNHYNIAWVVGDTPIDVKNQNSVLKYLKKYKDQYKSLICKFCGVSRISFSGFYTHIVTCGKTEEELEMYKVICNICNNKVLCLYKSQHIAKHREEEFIKERNLRNAEKKEREKQEAKLETVSGRRRAAVKARNFLKKYNNCEYNCPTCGFGTDHESELKNHKCDIYKDLSDSEESVLIDEDSNDESPDTEIDSNLSNDEETENIKKKRYRETTVVSKVKRIPFAVDNINAYLQESGEHFCKLYFTGECLYPEWRTCKYEVVSENDLREYLPKLEESCKVKLGNNTWSSYKRFEAKKEEGTISIFTGASIQYISWAPPHVDDVESKCGNYLAVACHQGADCPRFDTDETPTHSCLIQIWNFGSFKDLPKLILGIVHDYGTVWAMDWCPSGVCDLLPERIETNNTLRLGLLAVACSNGSVYIFSVPYLSSTIIDSNKIFYRLKPVAELKMSRGTERKVYQATSLNWSTQKRHTMILVGYADGSTAYYNMDSDSPILRSVENDITIMYPYHDERQHNSCVTGVSTYPSSGGGVAVCSGAPTGALVTAAGAAGGTPGGTGAAGGTAGGAARARSHLACSGIMFSPHWPSVLLAGDELLVGQFVNEVEWWGGGRRAGAAGARAGCGRCALLAAFAPPALRLLRAHPAAGDLRKQIIARLEMKPLNRKRKKQNDDLSMFIEPIKYEEAVMMYGIALQIFKKNDKALQQATTKPDYCPERFPLADVPSMAFCSSRKYHAKLAVATHAGVLFVIDTSSLLKNS